MVRPLSLLALLFPAVAWAAGGAAGLSAALLGLALFLGLAKLGADLAQRLKQPAVLGELMAGIALGNLDLLGVGLVEPLAQDATLSALAELGVILLLFEVGLESTVPQMLRVGPSALLAAVLGVIAPMGLGYGVGRALLPDASIYVHLFLGATLAATSVGISARVLRDLGWSTSPEARVILGAAVIDDVLGLIVLAAVAGVITAADAGQAPSAGPIAWIVAKAAIFLFGSLAAGMWLVPRLLRGAARLRGDGVLLGVSLAFCFLLSWLASAAGLAAIVGAFAAGLILESVHYKPFVDRGEQELEELIRPISGFLAPVFFVIMGMRVDLSSFAEISVLGLAAALTAAAIGGKLACGLGVLDRSVRRLPVALGMVPRGEVGLIFASIGTQLKLGGQPVISPSTFSAVVIMVVLTTLAAPPLLSASLRGRAPPPEGAP